MMHFLLTDRLGSVAFGLHGKAETKICPAGREEHTPGRDGS